MGKLPKRIKTIVATNKAAQCKERDQGKKGQKK